MCEEDRLREGAGKAASAPAPVGGGAGDVCTVHPAPRKPSEEADLGAAASPEERAAAPAFWRQADTTALAYTGDAVYELTVRTYVLGYVHVKTDRLNREAIEYVKADSQARAMKALMKGDFLTTDEMALAKRARNRTATSRPRGSSPAAYRLATALEALVGALYLSGRAERLQLVMEEVIETLGTMEERGFRRLPGAPAAGTVVVPVLPASPAPAAPSVSSAPAARPAIEKNGEKK